VNIYLRYLLADLDFGFYHQNLCLKKNEYRRFAPHAPGFGLDHPENAVRKHADRWFSLHVEFSNALLENSTKKLLSTLLWSSFLVSQTACE